MARIMKEEVYMIRGLPTCRDEERQEDVAGTIARNCAAADHPGWHVWICHFDHGTPTSMQVTVVLEQKIEDV